MRGLSVLPVISCVVRRKVRPLVAVVLIAKEPIPGKVKTRLHPPLSYEQAATLAAASITDTVDVVNDLPASRRILLFDGVSLPGNTSGWDIFHQVEGGLDERLAAIFDILDEPVVLIGMDTPQLTADDLSAVLEDDFDPVDAWIGMAADGGFWALGMKRPDGSLIRGVVMSLDTTGAAQYARLLDAGMRVRKLPVLVDVDTIEDAEEVARISPDTLFAKTLSAILRSYTT